MAQGDLLVEGREAFDANELVQVWFLYHLAVIGEAPLEPARQGSCARSKGGIV